MSLSVVQHKSATAFGTSQTLIFNSAPTAGNLLIFAVGSAARTVTPPGSFTLIDTLDSGSTADLNTYRHLVGAAEANSYQFSISGAADNFAVVGYEIAGAAASPINQHSINASASASSLATTSITPSVLSCLGLSFCTTNSQAPSSISAGWTINENSALVNHQTAGASKNALTTDTSTGISTTWT